MNWGEGMGRIHLLGSRLSLFLPGFPFHWPIPPSNATLLSLHFVPIFVPFAAILVPFPAAKVKRALGHCYGHGQEEIDWLLHGWVQKKEEAKSGTKKGWKKYMKSGMEMRN
jgi:hypothetical protein